MCGERVAIQIPTGFLRGSSPRVRGTRRHTDPNRFPPGFIPACAGNVRGCTRREPTDIGSSPRVRGTPAARVAHPGSDRFIPACAGNAGTGGQLSGEHPVHPRVCGERRVRTTQVATLVGSSPRVRGTLGERRGVALHQRFIPACAGNAIMPRLTAIGRPVHPRVCGERRPAPVQLESQPGSSPRVRGTRPRAA